MPWTHEAKWILDKGNYYLEEYGIDYFAVWKQVVKMQLELLDIENKEEFMLQWNAIQRIRKQMRPLLSKDGKTLFTLSNAFDNIMNVGLSYIKEQRKRLPFQIFLIEIMNDLITFIESAYYSLNEGLHIYYDSFDDDFSFDLALTSDFDFAKLSQKNSSFLSLKYYNPNNPVYLFFDWGGSVSFCLAAQYDLYTKFKRICLKKTINRNYLVLKMNCQNNNKNYLNKKKKKHFII